MTFALSAPQIAARDKARAFAQGLAARAAGIDHAGDIPADIAEQVGAHTGGEMAVTVVAVEEIAAASAAVATLAAVKRNGGTLGLSGLRGARELDGSPRGQLVLAAVALGIGRAALAAALDELRQSPSRPGADVEKPHWVVADVATDLEAARLLTYKAAQSTSDSEIAVARLMASAAAIRAVDAAVRVLGAAAVSVGSVIERLSRDVRVVSVLEGTEENHRALAAEGLLPQ